jgi:hypothetical protein
LIDRTNGFEPKKWSIAKPDRLFFLAQNRWFR